MIEPARHHHETELTALVDQHHQGYRELKTQADQKTIGQFFTPPQVAAFMASLVELEAPRIRLLDPGAGAGMLTAAVCDRIRNDSTPRHVEAHLYETDRDLLTLLHRTLATCQEALARRGHTLEFYVHPKDFILQGPDRQDSSDLYGSTGEACFDIVIMNPPYLKISGQSPYARAMATVVHGQPNLYALFMSLGAHVLRTGGQFVAITPRSYANGPYFRRFRKWFLQHMSLRRLHVFDSRRDAFVESGVLQENIITVATRQETQEAQISVSSSHGRQISGSRPSLHLPSSLVVDDSRRHSIIRIPTSSVEVDVIQALETLPHRFASIGLRVSTGPVVLFRAQQFVRRGDRPDGSIPLLTIHNVRPFKTQWPSPSERTTWSFCVTEKSKKLLVPAANYVLVRRFSAKEESRRLTASPIYSRDVEGKWMAIENHVNYVYHYQRSLHEHEVIAITAVMNSRILDIYFRAMSGCTQVNAAEMRDLPFLSIEELGRLGDRLSRIDIAEGAEVESAILEAMNINGQIHACLVSSSSENQEDLRGQAHLGITRPSIGSDERSVGVDAPRLERFESTGSVVSGLGTAAANR